MKLKGSILKRIAYLTLVTIAFSSFGCTSGRHYNKPKKHRKMKACDCPTFGYIPQKPAYYILYI